MVSTAAEPEHLTNNHIAHAGYSWRQCLMKNDAIQYVSRAPDMDSTWTDGCGHRPTIAER